MTGTRINTQKINTTSIQSRYLILFLSVICVLLYAGIGCSVQSERSLEKPTSIALEGVKAMEQLQWAAYAKLVHPDGLERFRNILMPDIERLSVNNKADSVTLFGKNFDVKTLHDESAEKFFIDMMDVIFKVSPELSNTFKAMNNNYIGSIAEEDSLVHVVVRTKMKIGNNDIEEMNVITLSQYENDWKVQLSNKIEGIALMLQQSLQQQR